MRFCPVAVRRKEDWALACRFDENKVEPKRGQFSGEPNISKGIKDGAKRAAAMTYKKVVVTLPPENREKHEPLISRVDGFSCHYELTC